MFFLLIVIAIIFIAAIVLLPSLSGLTKVSVETHPHHKKDVKPTNKKKQNDVGDNYQFGYVPPDELSSISNESDKEGFLKAEARALKEKLHVHSEDVPIKIKLKNFAVDENGLRRRKAEKLDLDTDPNSYDYDLDELIAEESESARQNAQREFYKDQKFGGEKEEMV